jgi:tRNA(adenine34) deaminase
MSFALPKISVVRYHRKSNRFSLFAGAPISNSEFSVPNILSVHDEWMRLALEEARRAFDEAEVPVGAIIVHDQRVIASAHNQREALNDPTAHAEMLAITQAAEALGAWRLLDCTLYVTLEPCPMCAGAIVQARIPTVVYGTTDPKAGACHTLYQITEDPRLNHRSSVLGGVLADECRAILQEFFAERRALGKN